MQSQHSLHENGALVPLGDALYVTGGNGREVDLWAASLVEGTVPRRLGVGLGTKPDALGLPTCPKTPSPCSLRRWHSFLQPPCRLLAW